MVLLGPVQVGKYAPTVNQEGGYLQISGSMRGQRRPFETSVLPRASRWIASEVMGNMTTSLNSRSWI